MWETHPQETKRTEEAHNQHRHKGRSRLLVEAEMSPGGQHIFILMHFKVCSYASLLVFSFLLKAMHIGLMNRRVLCLCFLWWCDRMCILEHRFICLTECFPRGEAKVQSLIDAGAFTTWVEPNGLEMVAEFTRSVGGNIKQENSMQGVRERFFLECVCMFLWASVGPYEH